MPSTTTTAELSPLMKSLLQGGEAEEDEEYYDSVEGEEAEDEEAKRKSKCISKHLASISAEKIMCITSVSGLLEHDWNRMELALARQISSETNHAVFLAKGGVLVWRGSA